MSYTLELEITFSILQQNSGMSKPNYWLQKKHPEDQSSLDCCGLHPRGADTTSLATRSSNFTPQRSRLSFVSFTERVLYVDASTISDIPNRPENKLFSDAIKLINP